MRWTIHLEGGPRRVNHAAVSIGNRIYSFGGFSSDTTQLRNGPIDIHVLNTDTYRWQKIALTDFRKQKITITNTDKIDNAKNTNYNLYNFINHQSASFTNNTNNSNFLFNSTTNLSTRQNLRGRSVAELHPYAQLRHFCPPINASHTNESSENETTFNFFERRRAAIVDNDNFSIECNLQNEENNVSNTVGIFQEDATTINQNNNNYLNQNSNNIDVNELIHDFNNYYLPYFNPENDYEDNEFNADFAMDYEGSENFDNVFNNNNNLRLNERRIFQQLQLNTLEISNNFMFSSDENINERRKLKFLLEAPFQRYGHTVVAYNNKAYLWGGRSDVFGTSSILHEFDPETYKWTIVKNNGNFLPPSRDGHSAVVYEDTMYVFGGFEEQFNSFSQETFAFNFCTGTWQLLKTKGEPPQHRDFHTACVLHNRMYIFGGRSDETGQDHSIKDIYCEKLKYLDLKKFCWVEVKTKGSAPCGRRSHSVWTYNEKMYIFGGYNSTINVHFNDIHEYNPKTNEWRLISLNSGNELRPTPRRRQCTVVVKNKVFLFGGTAPRRSKKKNRKLIDLSDLYVFDFNPTLLCLCAVTVIRYGLNKYYDYLLPPILRKELRYMHIANSINTATVSKINYING